MGNTPDWSAPASGPIDEPTLARSAPHGDSETRARGVSSDQRMSAVSALPSPRARGGRRAPGHRPPAPLEHGGRVDHVVVERRATRARWPLTVNWGRFAGTVGPRRAPSWRRRRRRARPIAAAPRAPSPCLADAPVERDACRSPWARAAPSVAASERQRLAWRVAARRRRVTTERAARQSMWLCAPPMSSAQRGAPESAGTSRARC